MPSRCILTALELDVFSAVAQGATAPQVAEKINASFRGTAILLNALVSIGLLIKNGEEFRNTPDAARYLVRESNDSHRDGLLHTANLWYRWSTLTEAVRLGSRVPLELARSAAWSVNFIAGMQRNARQRAPHLVRALGSRGVRRILDLGGGSGAYSIAFAHASPQVHCDILDLAQIVPLTSEYIAQAGVEKQVTVRAGDMLYDDLGSGYDLVLLNAICHMFRREQNRHLFRRARQALAPGGRLAVQDFILQPDKAGPQQAALFSVNMLVGTEAGACWTEAEYAGWMQEAGFTSVERIRLPGPASLMVGSVAPRPARAGSGAAPRADRVSLPARQG